MSGIITTLKKENLQNLPILTNNYNYIYPVTVLDAIYDNNGNLIKINFEEINNKLGLLENKLNSIQDTQTTINENLNNLSISNTNLVNLSNILENRLSSLEELRLNILSEATVFNDILTNKDNISITEHKFLNNSITNSEFEKIYNSLLETFSSFNISSNSFLLTIISNDSKNYLTAILKNSENSFYNSLNWFIIEYKTFL